MLKSRLGIWIMVIILCVGGTHLMDVVPAWLHPIQIGVGSEVSDISVMENIIDNRYGVYKVKSVSSNHDVIISHDTMPRNGYVIEEGALYSPLVLYFTSYADSENGGFIQQETNSSRKRIDFYTVLTAMENNKQWSDIGIHKKVANGEVVLYIPDERCWYYSKVEKLFYITLNGGSTPSDEQRIVLSERVNALLRKCIRCDSIQQSIDAEYSSPSDNSKVFLAPEMLYMNTSGMYNSSRSNKYIPVYPIQTVSLSLNIYLKSTYANENVAQGFLDALKNKRRCYI